jgi:hypothetical protein
VVMILFFSSLFSPIFNLTSSPELIVFLSLVLFLVIQFSQQELWSIFHENQTGTCRVISNTALLANLT